MEAPVVDDILDERATGIYLGGTRRPISPRTLQRWRQTGRGPLFVRLGSQIRYRKADLESWLASRTAQSTADRVGEHS